jgi:hypothetical protein
MKNFTKLFASLFLAFIFAYSLNAQVQIGSSSYSTLKAGFDAINAGTHTGNIVVQITNNTSESSTAILYGSGYGSASYSSVLIYPTGTYAIKGSIASNSIIALYGASNVTIDGRANQSGTTRALTINNTYTSTSGVIRMDSNAVSGGKGSKNNIIQYCNIIGGAKTACYAVVLGSSSSFPTSGYGNDGNTIQNNLIKFCYYGIYAYGISGYPLANLSILNNELGSTTASESIAYMGMYLYYNYKAKVNGNLFESMNYTSTIYGIYNYYSDYTEVGNNEMRGFSNTTTLYANYYYYSNYMNVHDNVIKNFSNTGSTMYGYYFGSCNYPTVTNNSIDNMKSTSSNIAYYFSTAASATITGNSAKNYISASTIYGFYIASAANSYVKNNTLDNLTTSNGVLYAFYLSSCGTTEVSGNVGKNLFLTSTFYGVLLSSCTYSKANNNTLDNVYSSTGTIYGIYLSSSGYSEANNNTVNALSAASTTYGMYFATCPDMIIKENKISDISAIGASSTSAIGLNFDGSANNAQIINNSISYIRTTGYSTSDNLYNPYGIRINGGTTHKLYYNSVYLSGTQLNTGTSGSKSAALMVSGTSTTTLDMRNNVFANTLTGLAGSVSYSIYLSSSSNLTSSTIDYNDYYVAGTYGMLGYLNGNVSTFPAWKTATGKDVNSINVDPLCNGYNNTAPMPGSLIVGKGIPISGILYDVKGDTRSITNPTIGAYEKAADIVGPLISFTKLLTTTDLNNRVINVTITDMTGVNNSSSVPKLYYRKTTNSNTYNSNYSSTDGWKYSTAAINGNTYTFTIDYSKIYGGATVGAVIEYFIIAQDVSPAANMSVVSGSFYTPPTSTDLTSANFPFTASLNYGLAKAYSGTYSIGSGNTYSTLSGPTGIFSVLNSGVLTGNIILSVTSDLSETGDFGLGKMVEEYGSGFTITIKSSTNTTRKISGAYAGGLIRLVGANNVLIDGTYNGSGNYLTFVNTATSGSIASLMIGSGGSANGGKNITVKNSTFYCGFNTSMSVGICVSDGIVSTSASSPDVDNLQLLNNSVYYCYWGILVRGTSAGMLDNLLIKGNSVGSSSSSSYIAQCGIDVQYATSPLITGNTVFNIINPSTANMWGIQLGGTLNGCVVEKNYIYSIKYTGSGGWGAYGINILGGTAIKIQNNIISDITTDQYSATSTTYNPFGIRIAGGSGHMIYNNTINMYGSQQNSGATASLTACIADISTYTGLDIRNNILINSLQGYTGTRSFCIFLYSTSLLSTVLSQCNYNDYYVSGAAGVFSGYGTAVPYTEAATFAALQAQTTKDQNSLNIKPVFISDVNPRLNGVNLGSSTLTVPVIAGVADDVDGEIRPTPNSFVGADEMTPVFALTTDTKFSPPLTIFCTTDNLDVSIVGEVTGFADGYARTGLQPVTYQWYKNGAIISDATTNKISFYPLKMSDSANYYATSTFMSKTLTSTNRLVKVEAPLAISLHPINTDVCTTNPTNVFTASVSGTITGLQWQYKKAGQSNWVNINGANKNNLTVNVNVKDPSNELGKYRLMISGPGNCGAGLIYTDSANLTVSEPIANVKIMTPDNLKSICIDGNFSMSVTSTGTVFGYQWQKKNGNVWVDLSVADYPSAKTPAMSFKNAKFNLSGTYRCNIYGSAACGTAIVSTDSLDVIVWPSFAIEEQPAPQVVCENQDVVLRVGAEGTIYKYQWQKDGVDITLAENAYANSPILWIQKAKYSQSGKYRCLLDMEDCRFKKNYSTDEVGVYVGTKTDITDLPETQPVMLGHTATFEVRAHVNGAPNNYQTSVQWYKANKPLVDDGRIVGSKSSLLVINNVQLSDAGVDYSVIIKGLCGSDTAKVFGITISDMAIIEHPKDISACESTDAVFSVLAKANFGTGTFTYQWYKDNIPLTDVSNISGAKSAKLTIANVKAGDAGRYYAIATYGSEQYTAKSNPAYLTARLKPLIYVQPVPSIKIAPGKPFTISVKVANNVNTYQWYLNDAAIAHDLSDTYTVDAAVAEDGGIYKLVATNDCGEVTSTTCEVMITTTTTDVTEVEAGGFKLGSAVPNPVLSISSVSYTLPRNSDVKISLYNELGIEVTKLVNALMTSGNYSLNINAGDLKLTSGTYFIVLKAGEVVLNQRIVIIK